MWQSSFSERQGFSCYFEDIIFQASLAIKDKKQIKWKQNKKERCINNCN